jgi:hypothetical protein
MPQNRRRPPRRDARCLADLGRDLACKSPVTPTVIGTAITSSPAMSKAAEPVT